MVKRKERFNFWNDGLEVYIGSWYVLDRVRREKIVMKVFWWFIWLIKVIMLIGFIKLKIFVNKY